MGNLEALKELREKRRLIKGSLTRVVNFIKENELTELNRLKFVAKWEILSGLFDSYRAVQEGIINKEEDEQVVKCEEKDFEDFEERYFETKILLGGILGQGTRVNAGSVSIKTEKETEKSNSSGHNNTNLRLPKIEIQRFNGDLDEWLKFYEKFSSIINGNKDLSGLQKFHYLVSFLEGEAAEFVTDIEISDKNYQFAWDTLVAKYSNKRRLIETHLSNIFNVPVLQNQSAKGLRDLFNLFTKNLNALKKLSINTENGDPYLAFLITSKFDKKTSEAWESQISGSQEMPKYSDVYKFLEKRCNYLEAMERKAGDKLGNKGKREKDVGKGKSVMLTHSSGSCSICGGSEHKEFKCKLLLNSTVKERRNIANNKRLCWLCLSPKHQVIQCKFKPCFHCKGRHSHLLCLALKDSERETDTRALKTGKEGENNNEEKETAKSSLCITSSKDLFQNKSEVILIATVVVNIRKSGDKYCVGRFILDSGSEVNLITQSFANRLGLKWERESADIYGIGGNVGSRTIGCIITEMSSRTSPFTQKIKFSIVPAITSCHFNKNKIKYKKWEVPENIISNLADPNFYDVNNEIDGLLGAGLFFEVLGGQRYYPFSKKGNKGLYFLNTKLGWILSGLLPTNISTSPRSCFFIQRETTTSKRNDKISEDISCENLFCSTLKVHPDGRFIVDLPLISDPAILGDSFEGAKARFLTLERKLSKNPELRKHYTDFINDYAQRGHMELVPETEIDKHPRFYFPHHAVFKESTTTQWRVVFEAQFKSTGGVSLNNILATGPNLQNDLCNLILSFRLPKCGLTADIAKMFRQIWVNNSQIDLQRILWRDSPDKELQHFRLKTVTYGTVSAPYLAMRCLRQIAQNIGDTEPKIANTITSKFYMDDLLTGSDSLSDLVHIKSRVEEVLKEKGFLLRKWCSNSKELMNTLGSETVDQYCVDLDKEDSIKTLGMVWNPSSDNFIITIQRSVCATITKRTILSDIQGLWDPIGLLTPAIIRSKIFLQDLWLLGLDWDEPLVTDLRRRWSYFREEIVVLNKKEIPRRVITDDTELARLELHGFSDASEKAYGCCIYLATVNVRGICRSELFCAKGRVAPLQATTLPRLELLGALALARLMDKVIKLLDREVTVFYWTDSKIVLSWLNGHSRQWKLFVANRVQEIQELTNVNKWHHVPSKLNPADLVSRGMPAKDLINCNLWWKGPSDIFENLDHWCNQKWNILPEVPEVKRVKCSLLTMQINNELLERYSSWSKLLRISAYLFRFINNCRKGITNRTSGRLQLVEVNEARGRLLKLIQILEFQKEFELLKKNENLPKSNKLKGLSVFVGEDGLLRVGGRLNKADFLTKDHRNPILLPAKHHITKIIMRQLHYDNLHVGPQTLLAITRCQFWPIKGKVLAKAIVRECVICTKANPKFFTTIMADLPKERFSLGRVFNVTGVDLCGPILIKSGIRKIIKTKAYVVVFVCFATKAVHIELVTALSTEAFMAAFKRFISRRGKPGTMFSDNGTNFVGAQRELKKIFDHRIQEQGVREGIDWKFIPPNSPHFGGLWEAAVKRVKYHLVRMMGGALLGLEEANTLLIEIESCLNSRPITPLSSDPQDFSFLTPAHFLVGGPLNVPPEPSLLGVPENRLKRWKLVEKMQQSFWKRWSKEYLTLLQQKNKWFTATPNLAVGDLVVVKEDNMAPMQWKTARVVLVHPGQDNVVRVVTVRFSTGQCLKRPMVKLAPLIKEA